MNVPVAACETITRCPSPPSRDRAYRPDIDGLRAVAVTLVLLVHAFPEHMRNGFVGVDIFFVISGFLITGIIAGQMREGTFSLRDFYIRRANRIFPALIVTLAVTLAFGWASLYASEYKLLGRSSAAGAGFLANVNAYLEGGYWDIDARLKPLLHLWSLGVEEQFYLFWPMLLFIVWRGRAMLTATFLVLIVASMAWNLWSVRFNQPVAFFLPFSRLWELLAGGALTYIGTTRMGPVARNAAAILGACLIAAVLIESFSPSDFPGWHVMLPVFGTALIIGAGPTAWLNAKVLANPLAVSVGAISYPLYLWHWPLLTYGHILQNGEIPVPTRSALIVATVLLAICTYRFIEKKISRRDGRSAVILTAMLALCGAAGFAIAAADGLAARYPAPIHVAAPDPVPINSKVALIGDSNAGMLAEPLFSAYGAHLVTFVTPSWAYLAGTDLRPDLPPHPSRTGTPEMTNHALDAIISDPNIRVVVIAHMYKVYLDQDEIRSVPPVPGETGTMAYEAGLRRTVQMLTAAGKKVSYVKTIPFRGDVGSILACSSSRPLVPRKRPQDCDLPIAAVQPPRAVYDQVVRQALDDLPGVTTFDTTPFVCDTVYCYVERDGVLLYRDLSHLSDDGSRLVVRDLSRQIEQATRSDR